MAAKKRKPARPAAKKAAKKPAAKKAAKRPAAKANRKAASRKPAAAAKARPVSISSVNKAFSKGQLLSALADSTGIQKRSISSLLDDLGTIIAAHLKKQGPGQFTLPGLVKISVKHKPATKARKGVNPFTGEEMMFKAKPARNVVKVRPLQKLKQMV